MQKMVAHPKKFVNWLTGNDTCNSHTHTQIKKVVQSLKSKVKKKQKTRT